MALEEDDLTLTLALTLTLTLTLALALTLTLTLTLTRPSTTPAQQPPCWSMTLACVRKSTPEEALPIPPPC